MINSCTEFLAVYSDLRDGELSLPRRIEAERHLAECASCARYDQVVRDGVQVARALPEIEPSPDFLLRLQHRILHLDEERRGSRTLGSGVPPALALAVAASIAVAAWIPAARPEPPTHSLPPATALSPGAADADLFSLPASLASTPSARSAWEPAEMQTASLLFQHSPLGQSVREAVEVRYTQAP